jgi:hypothetical protein
MISAFVVHNLIHYEVAKVTDNLYELVILVWVPSRIFIFLQLQENKFRFTISQHKWTFHTTSEDVQTYYIGVSVVATDGTHHNTCVVSIM